MIDHSVAIAHLRRCDPVMAKVIKAVGPCTLKHTGARFELLAKSILSQQISVAAARTIRQRLEAVLPGSKLSAAGILSLTEDQLAATGVSRQKRGYLLNLCEKADSGELNFRRIAKSDNESVIAELTKVKGIGRWTAQMFLLFGMGRPDVFAADDLGLQNAIKAMFPSMGLNRPADFEALSSPWSPYRSVASWYLWRSLDLNK